MELSEEHRREVERKIVGTIITGLEQNTLPNSEFEKVASFILDKMKNVKTHEELVLFLRDLSSKWSIFTSLLVIESGELKEEMEEKAADKVLSLAKEGKVEDALSLAKQANNS
ncbi:MAG: hypothetical protein M1450_04690 [Patescibacteria group bacterium]|nr:hypothetical protein [Patescibacteria group bacterium]